MRVIDTHTHACVTHTHVCVCVCVYVQTEREEKAASNQQLLALRAHVQKLQQALAPELTGGISEKYLMSEQCVCVCVCKSTLCECVCVTHTHTWRRLLNRDGR